MNIFNKSKKIVVIILITILLTTLISINKVFAGAPNGIYNNGLNGIYIDINSSPYTNFQTYGEWGQYAYTTVGCAWFASARVNQLTGKGNTIFAGDNWYYNQYANYGFSRGQSIRAKALACYTGHVAVIEAVDGNTVTISEGGVNYAPYASNGYARIATKTISEVQSSDFIGYVYITSVSAITVTNDSVTNISYTDAKISATLSPLSYTTTCGFYIGTSASSLTKITETANANVSSIWYNLATDWQALTPGTTYYYKIFAIVNGVEYQSAIASFSTTPVYATLAEVQQAYRDILEREADQSGIDNYVGHYTVDVLRRDLLASDEYKQLVASRLPGKPTLTIAATNKSTEKVQFSWAVTSKATHYDLRILQNGSVINTIYSIVGTNYAIQLPTGSYTAYLCSVNANYTECWTKGDDVNFVVTPADYVPKKTMIYNDHIYSIYDEALNWNIAKDICVGLGGHLATITSQGEQEAINNLLLSGTKTSYYLGGTDEVTEGTFTWVTNEPFSYTNWNTGEPNNSGGIEDYLMVHNQASTIGKWNDVPNENSTIGFICEVEPTNTPTATTTYNGSKYLLFDNTMSWKDAKAACELMGGHLATITSQGEQDAINNLLLSGTKINYYIGATDEASKGTFNWVTGEPFNYTNWNTNQPDNYLGIEDYLMVYNQASIVGKWNDVSNNNGIGFICEIIETPTVYFADFENNSTGWSTLAGGTMAVTTAFKHTGAKSLSMTARTAAYHSPMYNLYPVFKTNGAGKYTITMWVSVSTSCSVGYLLRASAVGAYSFLDSGWNYRRMYNPYLTANVWTQLSYAIDVTENDLTQPTGLVNLCIDTPGSPYSADVYFDDVTITFVAAPTPTVPPTPTDLTSTSKTDTTVDLSWTSVTGATGYNLYNGTTKLTETPITTNTYSVTGLTQNTAYSFTITAVNEVAESLPSAALSVTTDITPIVPEGIVFETSTGTITDYTGLAENLVIPPTIGGVVVKKIGDYAFNSCASLTSITIPSSVTSIGDDAFSYCASLTSISIPSSVTSIGYHAFYYCTSLTSINVDIANLNYSSDNGILYNKNKTTLIECPTGKSESITIPSSVTSIGDMAFSKCTSLTSITIPSSVTSIGSYAFNYCASLTSITIPSGVTSIGSSIFYYCISLTSINVDIANLNYSSDNGILYNKNKTTLIECPVGKSGSITIPSGVTSIGSSAFNYCISLTSINVDIANLNYLSDNGILYNKNKTTLIECPVGKSGSITIPSGVTSIGYHAFYSCTSLTSITIPNSVTSIDKFAFDYRINIAIYAHKASYGESYAIQNSIPFVALYSIIYNSQGGSVVSSLDIQVIRHYPHQ